MWRCHFGSRPDLYLDWSSDIGCAVLELSVFLVVVFIIFIATEDRKQGTQDSFAFSGYKSPSGSVAVNRLRTARLWIDDFYPVTLDVWRTVNYHSSPIKSLIMVPKLI